MAHPMRVTLILPALTEALSPYFRPIKYSLFPPLGLATLAAHLPDDTEITMIDEHVEPVPQDDEPDLVAIQVYITSATRAYALADRYRARGAYVCLGGPHVTSLPTEALAHADTVFLGPGDATWPEFLADLRSGRPRPVYRSSVRTLDGTPPPRRDLIRRDHYLVPNSIVVSRGCPHRCDFCYKEAFYRGGRGFYTRLVDAALAEIDGLPGRHLYFLDDNLLADPMFAGELFEGMRGMGRLWQGAATVGGVLRPGLLEKAAACGLRSLFVGFETLDRGQLRQHRKSHSSELDPTRTVRRLHDLGVMINASFVFGLDGQDVTVFDRTLEWAIRHGVETATFHILTPYPGTALHRRLEDDGRIAHRDWELYDTRHVVFEPHGMTADQLQDGYWRSYREFYSWQSIARAAVTKPSLSGALRHLAYSGAWKKAEPLWGLIISTGQLRGMRPLLELVLAANQRATRVVRTSPLTTRAPARRPVPAPLDRVP